MTRRGPETNSFNVIHYLIPPVASIRIVPPIFTVPNIISGFSPFLRKILAGVAKKLTGRPRGPAFAEASACAQGQPFGHLWYGEPERNQQRGAFQPLT